MKQKILTETSQEKQKEQEITTKITEMKLEK